MRLKIKIYGTVIKMSGLGERIEKARKLEGLEQNELAEKVGLTQQAISRIESGLTKNPRNLRAIAKALNVSVNFLLTGEDDFIESYRIDTDKGTETKSILELISHLTSSQRMEAIKFMEQFKQKNEEVFVELGDFMQKKLAHKNNHHAHA